MANDQTIGSMLLLGAIGGIVLYCWLLFFVDAVLVLQLTAFLAITLILVIVGWIGYTMTTTPPPESIEFDAVS